MQRLETYAHRERCVICTIETNPAAVREMLTGRYDCDLCGSYLITREALVDRDLRGLGDGGNLHVLRSLTRRATTSNRVQNLVKITTELLSQLEHYPMPSVLEKMDMVLQFVADRCDDPAHQVKFDYNRDYPLAFARNSTELRYLAFELIGRGLLRAPSLEEAVQISPTGWARLDELQRTTPMSNTAFVAMWFDTGMEAAWAEGFKPGIENSERFKAVRIDKVEHTDLITDRIIAGIRAARFVVADATGGRQGVYYEAGFAYGLGKPVIWCCRADRVDDMHFDTEHLNHIIWNDPAHLRERLDARIGAVIL